MRQIERMRVRESEKKVREDEREGGERQIERMRERE